MRSEPLRIVIPGGSGHVGQVLAEHFLAQGDSVTVLARHSAAIGRTVIWDGRTLGAWTDELGGADLVINLAGRSVNCRYTKANRREIMESRAGPTLLIGRTIARCGRPPAVWMNASTATIYRHAFDRDMDEATGEIGGGEPGAPDAWRFSIDVATSWERAFFESLTPQTRKIALRSAMIMSPEPDGLFDTLLKLVRIGVGGSAGSGKQFVSWIHYADFVAVLEFLLVHQEMDGVVNVSSPNPQPNRELMRALRAAWGAPVGLPAASWMLELGAIFLRTETELILKSRRVVPRRLLDAGFKFAFPEWPAAARDLISRWRELRRASDKAAA